MAIRTETLPVVTAPHVQSAALPSSGLLALGVTVLPFSLYASGHFPYGAPVLGLLLFCGGLGQVAAGLLEWRRGHAFGCIAFIPFGLFWFSQIAMAALPEAGLTHAPQAPARAFFLLMWGLFALILYSGARQVGRWPALTFGLVAACFLLLTVGIAAGSAVVLAIACGAGIACCFSAIYAALGRLPGDAGEPVRNR